MSRVLVTGISGAGKSTVLNELRRRGHDTVDTDYDRWVLPDGSWDEPRMEQLLAGRRDVVVSGTVQNQGRFYDRFEHVVLLSAPLDVLMQRVTCRPQPSVRQVTGRPRGDRAVRADGRTASATRGDGRARRAAPHRRARRCD